MSKRKNLSTTGVLAAAAAAALSVYAMDGIPSLTIGSAAAGAAARASAAPTPRRVLANNAIAAAPVQQGFDSFIVRYRDEAKARKTPDGALAAFALSAQRAGVMGAAARGVSAEYVRRMGVGADVIRLSRKLDSFQAGQLLAQLRSDPSVASAELDLMLYPTADFVPNDTRYPLQWHYQNVSGATLPLSPGGINLPKAWGNPITNNGASVPTPNGAGIVVAVIDTGYVPHADLAANIVPGYDFISAYGQNAQNPNIAGDGDGRDADARDVGDWIDGSMSSWCGNPAKDSSWHGTHVAGTVAAVTNNASGVAGVAFNAKVMPVRALGHCGGYTSDIADALTWASGGSVPGVPANPDPAEVVNMSLGGGGVCAANSVTQLAIDGAVSRGVAVVVAAGNDSTDAVSKTPASCNGVVAVGATGVDGSRAFYSNYGLNVTLSAPGGGGVNSGNDITVDNVVWSTWNSGKTTPVASADGGDIIGGMIGTSMASPHVAGVVALMQSAAVSAGRVPLTPALVRQVLAKTARAFPVVPTVPMGVGIVDANAAVNMAKGVVVPDPAIVLTNRTVKVISSSSKSPLYNVIAGSSNLFVLNNVPAGTAAVNFRTYGGTTSSDVALYVKRGSAPTTTDYDAQSVKAGTAETVMLTNPAAGSYYVLVVNTKASNNVQVLAAY